MTPRERVILALDVPTESEALAWAGRMRGRVGMFKVGLRLFTAAGPALAARIASQFGPVFLDLKYHDIPNTVGTAVREAAGLGATMLTVHASGGSAMLRAAGEAAAAAPGAGKVRIVAVTVLTSLGEKDLAAAGVARGVEEQVLALAETAWEAGCDGFVASPREVAALRGRLGAAPLIVTPGIRAAGAPADDQNRTASAREALDAGATFLVIGRPILAAADPDAALDSILATIG